MAVQPKPTPFGKKSLNETAFSALADFIRPTDTGPKDLFHWTEYNCQLAGRPYKVPLFYREIYESKARRLFIRKAAQTFASQFMIYSALWCPATGQGQRGNSLYVFPAEKQLGEFCRGRIDPVIQRSPKIRAMLGSTDNTFQKAINDGFLYLRGAQSDTSLISVDADMVLLDEVARFPANTIDLVERRLGSSYLDWVRAASTPVYPSDPSGILWERSTKRYYEVKCSHCSTIQHLEVDGFVSGDAGGLNPDTALVECVHCHGDMSADRLGEGHWTVTNPNGDWEGYQVNKMYSFRVDLVALADTYRAVLRGDVSQTGLQEFYNQDVGRPYLPEGGHVDPERLDACCTDPAFTALPSTGRDCVMGVDVGKVLHVTINQPRDGLLYKAFVGTVPDFSDLSSLINRYDVRRCVIDGAPETRAARAFADSPGHRGRVYLATYVDRQDANKSQLCFWDDDNHTVRINRTMALDSTIHNVDSRRLVLPSPPPKARDLGGQLDRQGSGTYYRHMCSPIRVMDVGPTGEMVARYDQNGPDHYAHAEVYALAAADQVVGDMGVPVPSPQRQPDPEDPYDTYSPMDAFFLQDSFYMRQVSVPSYGRRPVKKGQSGFHTGSGRHVPATPAEWVNALDYSTPDDPLTGPARDQLGLPPLDFSHAFPSSPDDDS